MKIPAISVIIPLYNAQNFIGECLDSLLVQTFTDFEIIVVDDCSTDSSRAVVERYAPRFNGRLTLIGMQKNSGGCAVPRNKGLSFSRGEYIFFLDADDTVTPTAFEELYSVAKDFDADVVACEKYYEVPEKFWNNADFRRNLKPTACQAAELVAAPTLIADNPLERARRYNRGGLLWNVWSKLIRRDFIFDNEISFADTLAEDLIFTGCLLFAAERFILVPNVINYYRLLDGSVSHAADDASAYFRKYVRALTTAFRHFDDFLSGRGLPPDAKHLVLKRVWLEINGYVLSLYDQVPAYELDKILREELSGGDNVALAAFAFNSANENSRLMFGILQDFNELERSSRQDKAYIAELENFILQMQQSKE